MRSFPCSVTLNSKILKSLVVVTGLLLLLDLSGWSEDYCISIFKRTFWLKLEAYEDGKKGGPKTAPMGVTAGAGRPESS